MPKNKIGGNKSKKQKNTVPQENNNYPLADNPDLLYAIVLKKLGGKFICLKCSDGKERIGRICGSMWKRSFMQIGDFLLISKREFSTKDNKCDILYKYQPYHANLIITTYNLDSLKNNNSYNENITSDFTFQENDYENESNNSDSNDSNYNFNNEYKSCDSDSDTEHNLNNINKSYHYHNKMNYNNDSDNESNIDINNI